MSVVFTGCLTKPHWTSGRKEVNFFSFPISIIPNTVNKEVLELFKAGWLVLAPKYMLFFCMMTL